MDMQDFVAIFRPKDGHIECPDTNVLCMRHGVLSLPRGHDVTLTRAEAERSAERLGLTCYVCGAVIVPPDPVFTATPTHRGRE